jgi:hypothetical protein
MGTNWISKNIFIKKIIKKKKKKKGVFWLCKAPGVGFTGIGPALSSTYWGPYYSHKACPALGLYTYTKHVFSVGGCWGVILFFSFFLLCVCVCVFLKKIWAS